MKTTKKTRVDEYPKPKSAPEPATAVVLFKSGAPLTLEFISNGSADLNSRQKFVMAYNDWVTGASKIPGGEFKVADWRIDSTEHTQMIAIHWDTVQAINHTS